MMSYEFYKNALTALLDEIITAFNGMWEKRFAKSIILPIHIKGK